MTRFAASLVQFCGECHLLTVTPLVDARIPSVRDHVKCLTEEIAVEEEEAQKGKRLTVAVEAAEHHKGGAKVRAQIIEGDPRWVVVGSRVEAFHARDKTTAENAVNAAVVRKGGGAIEIEADDGKWAALPAGAQLLLQAQTNATLYRNLLKAFHAVRRLDPRADALLDPRSLPKLPAPGRFEPKHLRPRQAEAAAKALALEDGGVLLVQGPPGTGKTTVIARVVSDVVRAGGKVLVTSHTHVAIDNALRKAVKGDRALRSKMVRLGDSRNVGVDMVPFTHPIAKFHEDPEEEGSKPLFSSVFDKFPIVGMTLDSLACAFVYAEQLDQTIDRFDLVIVDEAGMNAYPKLAVAHAAGKRMMLVGDPMQLPPIIRAWSYRDDENYRRSHFELLQMQRPDLSVMLDEQFRSDPDVYMWSNEAVYEGQVTSQRGPGRRPKKLLGHAVDRAVVWVDTGRVEGNKSVRAGGSHVNPSHTAIAAKICIDLIKQGFQPEEIGYISPFKAQAQAFIEAAAEHRHKQALTRVIAATVDAFQGSERRAIIYDLTTLTPRKPHEDHRRLNVSLTRAQDVLIVLGPDVFVDRPQANPFYWSLQKWQAPQRITA